MIVLKYLYYKYIFRKYCKEFGAEDNETTNLDILKEQIMDNPDCELHGVDIMNLLMLWDCYVTTLNLN